MNPVFADLPVSIFEIMSLEAKTRGAVNLGQGFPETDGFPDVREAAGRALMEQSNQYAPMRGLPVLRQAVADFYERRQGLKLDPDTQVLITSGATEAICATILSMITPGDEVVVFEPMYDAYVPLIRRAGGVPRIVEVKGMELDAAFSPAMLYVNNLDKPGFIGALGALLGEAGVNIATFNLGRREAGDDAIALVGVDQAAGEDLIAKIAALPHVKEVRALTF